jgi:outer membrane receptor protein involved in Fe transport
MIRNKVYLLFVATALTTPSLGYSQEAPEEDIEFVDAVIVVTATRSGSAIEELPLSISVVSEAEVQDQLRQNRNILTGLEFVLPGLSVQDRETLGSCSGRYGALRLGRP